MPKIYQARTTIIPLESSQTGISTTLAGMAGMAGINVGKTTPAEKFVAVLDSRTLAENVIRKLSLLSELFAGSSRTLAIQDGVRILKGITQISTDRKSGLVSVTVEYKDPERAAQIANAFVEELDHFMNTNALTLAKKKRLFLEQQIAQAKEQMKVAEEKLKEYQQNKRLPAPDLQAQATIKGLSDLKAEVISKEVQLGVLRSYATSQNPEVQTLQEQINMLRQQLAKLEAGGKNPSGGSDLSLQSAPQLALSFERYKREIEFQGKMLEILVPQYEVTKMEEAKEDISFQVIDRAVPPIQKFKPRIKKNVLFSGVLSIFFGIFVAFFAHYVERIKTQSVNTSMTIVPQKSNQTTKS
jgi:capsule polysaccharide export protein KpsE/RkpR